MGWVRDVFRDELMMCSGWVLDVFVASLGCVQGEVNNSFGLIVICKFMVWYGLVWFVMVWHAV
jgi:hypothetical protein